MARTKFENIQMDLSKGMNNTGRFHADQKGLPRTLKNLWYNQQGDLTVTPSHIVSSGIQSYSLSGTSSDAPLNDVSGNHGTVMAVGQLDRSGYLDGATTTSITARAIPSVFRVLSGGASPTLSETEVPAPYQATPVFVSSAPTAVSLGVDSSGDPMLVNCHTLMNVASASTMPTIAPWGGTNSQLYNLFPAMSYPKAAGRYIVGPTDSVGMVVYLPGVISGTSWLLRDDAGVALTASGTLVWDVIVIGTVMYVAAVYSGNVTIHRYEISGWAAGSATATPTNVNATHSESYTPTYGAGTRSNTHLAFSSSEDLYDEVRLALAGRDTSNSLGYVAMIRIEPDDATVISASNSSAATLQYAFALTCNHAIILCERSASSTPFKDDAFVTGAYSTLQRNSSRIYAFHGITAAESSYAFTTTPEINLTTRGNAVEADARLMSHIHDDGRVAIGRNLFRVYTLPDATVKVEFLQKFCAYSPILSLNGYNDLNFSTHMKDARQQNTMSRWVGDYVAVPIGGGEYSPPIANESGDVASAAGITLNDSVVVFDCSPCRLEVVEGRAGVTYFGHGWSLSPDGKALPSCAVDRPVVLSDTYDSTNTRTGSSEPWTVDSITSYRVLMVHSIGGLESYVSSATYVMGAVASGDLEKDVIITIACNNLGVTGGKLRIYRNNSAWDAGGDFYFLGEATPTNGTATFTDRRTRAGNVVNPAIDPTGGGSWLQCGFLPGQRSLAMVEDRLYAVGSQHAVCCQYRIGDDQLPAPYLDAAIELQGTGLQVLSSLGTPVVATTAGFWAIVGQPPSPSGGSLQAATQIAEGVIAVGRGASTPAGAAFPTKGKIVTVSSQGVTSITNNIPNHEQCRSVAYSPISGRLYGASDNAILVYDLASERWTMLAKPTNYLPYIGVAWSGPREGFMFWASTNAVSAFGIDEFAVGAASVTATIETGWVFPAGRQKQCILARLLIDGYCPTVVTGTVQFGYNGQETLDTVQTRTHTPSAEDDDGALRLEWAPARAKLSSVRATVTVTGAADTVITSLGMEGSTDSDQYTSSMAIP